MAKKTPANPCVLKWARESANLTINEVHKIKRVPMLLKHGRMVLIHQHIYNSKR